MIRKNKTKQIAASLRLKAEVIRRKKEIPLDLPRNIDEIKILHREYLLQKIELDILNDEIQKARKEAEIANEKFHNIYDFAPTGYFTFTIDGEITSLNINGARLLSYEKTELINKNIKDFITEESRYIFNNFLKEVFTGNSKINCELMISSQNNLPVFVMIEGVLNKYGEKCLATVIDITDRKKAEGRIIEREKNTERLYTLLRRITDNMPDMLWAKDLNNRYIFANKAMCEKLFNTKDTNEPVGRNDMFFAIRERSVNPENPNWHTFGEMCRDSEEAVIKSGKTEHFEEFGNIKNKFLFLDVYKSPLFDEEGSIVGTVGAGRDVTKEKAIEKELLESEELYRKLVSTSPDAINMTDMEGNITFASPKSLELFGYNDDSEIIDRPLINWIAPENREKGIKNFKHIINNGVPLDKEYILIKKDTSYFHGEINASIIRSADQKPKGLIIITRDITDRMQADIAIKEREIKLKELNATKDKFFSIIAHDLKSPFNGIIGITNLMKEESKRLDLHTLHQYANMINSSAVQTYRLLENLLNWARIQQGKITFTPSNILLKHLVNEVITLLHENAYQKKIHIIDNTPSNLKVKIDEGMIETILRNLVSNAIKFTPVGGRIEIQTLKINIGVEISVSDNGVGITKENIQKLFNIDTNYSIPGTEKEKGTGLGLILCKEFAEKHNGEISVESTIGKGSKFTISLPSCSSEFIDAETYKAINTN
jgi:PAS domain S-box-containing protein